MKTGIILFILLWLAILNLRCSGAIASWYGEEHRGKIMANGKPFDPDKMTCASWDYPLGTKLRVTHGRRSVVVTVTDRGPGIAGRDIDLSRAAFAKIGALRKGLIKVRIEKDLI